MILYCGSFCGELRSPEVSRFACARREPFVHTAGIVDHLRAIMPLRVSGKNIKVGEALRGRINARLADAMAKYFNGGFSGHVTIGREGFCFRHRR
jgi:hypothetical protein